MSSPRSPQGSRFQRLSHLRDHRRDLHPPVQSAGQHSAAGPRRRGQRQARNMGSQLPPRRRLQYLLECLLFLRHHRQSCFRHHRWLTHPGRTLPRSGCTEGNRTATADPSSTCYIGNANSNRGLYLVAPPISTPGARPSTPPVVKARSQVAHGTVPGCTRAEVRGTTVYASDSLPLGDIEGISAS